VAVPLALWFAPIDVDARTRHVLAIAAFMILSWITRGDGLPRSAGFHRCYPVLELSASSVRRRLQRFATDTHGFPLRRGAVRRDGDKTGLARQALPFVVMQRVGTRTLRRASARAHSITDFLLTSHLPRHAPSVGS